jgi:hypothetical protein
MRTVTPPSASPRFGAVHFLRSSVWRDWQKIAPGYFQQATEKMIGNNGLFTKGVVEQFILGDDLIILTNKQTPDLTQYTEALEKLNPRALPESVEEQKILYKIVEIAKEEGRLITVA